MIRILEDRIINKIAAGEVVERPASVVKELVENAVDAGATVLRVEIKSGGRNLIRVSDNGCGMDRHDATMSLERHATSKIRTDADLLQVDSLGFRGEALPSIAAVSRFELRSRRASDDAGTRLVVEGGRLLDVSDAGCPVGTDIVVRSLFFNIPARRKFLRTVPTELSHCLEAVVRQALVLPGLDVEVRHDDQVLLRAPAVADRATRAADLLGPHGRALVPVSFTDGDLSVDGLVSPVGVHRGHPRGATYLYVNGRFVRDRVVRRGVMEAYRSLVPKGRHPTVVVEVRIPPDQVDVNVHPAKTEVRFRHGRQLEGALAHGIRTALEAHGIRRPVAVEARYRPPDVAESPDRQAPLLVSRPPVVADHVALQPHFPAQGQHTHIASEPTPDGDLLPVPRFADLRVLGQLAQTYVLCEGNGVLVIVDQHAAHERITLHHLKQNAAAHLGGAQRLLSPPIIELTPARAQALTAVTETLSEHGLEVEPFGGGSFAVKQVPSALNKVDIQRLMEDIADDVAEGGSDTAALDVIEHVLATMACHASVRAGQTLSTYEMNALLGALDEVDFSVCAHGRPVAIRISPVELERRFHRS